MTIIELKVSYIARSFDSGNLTIKSIIILSYSKSRTGINYIYLYLVYLADLFYWHWIYSLIYYSTYIYNFGTI